eukprot:6938252-Prorocentrum_lima.AAC.1
MGGAGAASASGPTPAASKAVPKTSKRAKRGVGRGAAAASQNCTQNPGPTATDDRMGGSSAAAAAL